MGPKSGRAQRSRRRSWVDMTVRPLYKPPARLAFWARGYAQVAQLVEHATENRSVGGSIPPLGTIHLRLARILKMPPSEGSFQRSPEGEAGWFDPAIGRHRRSLTFTGCELADGCDIIRS